MELYTLAAFILGFSALASVFATRVLRMPETIGLIATGLIASAVLLLADFIFPQAVEGISQKVIEFDFSSFVLDFALGFLMFAGAFQANARAMSRDRCLILAFATFGILISTFVVGGLSLWHRPAPWTARSPLHPLPPVWRSHLADGSHRSAGDLEGFLGARCTAGGHCRRELA